MHVLTLCFNIEPESSISTELVALITVAQDEGVPPLSDTISVTVRVDPTPPTFDQLAYTASVDEFSGQVCRHYTIHT